VTDSGVLVVNRWKRYGKDRLYVETTAGDKVGWWDLLTQEPHPESAEHLPALTQAVNAWLAGGETVVATPPEPVVAPPLETPWVDLALNRPGEGVRDRADSEFVAAPVRSTIARLLGVHGEEAGWRKGADGEERVGDQLAKVERKDPRWRFIHSIPVGKRGADIDHLAIGPGGVFTINAKHHQGKDIWVGTGGVLVGGHRTDHVRNSRYEAARAARLLSERCGVDVPVLGLVVTVNEKNFRVKAQPEGVHVLRRVQLARWLLGLGPTLDDERLVRIFEVARRSTTWR
jgi:hypothetical protein